MPVPREVILSHGTKRRRRRPSLGELLIYAIGVAAVIALVLELTS